MKDIIKKNTVMKKITNIICIFLSAVVLFSCGDDNTNNEQGEGTIGRKNNSRAMLIRRWKRTSLKVNISGGTDIKSVVWTMEGQTLGEESELKYVFKKEGIYNVSVRVTDNAGNVAGCFAEVTSGRKEPALCFTEL